MELEHCQIIKFCALIRVMCNMGQVLDGGAITQYYKCFRTVHTKDPLDTRVVDAPARFT